MERERIWVKICCIESEAEAEMALAAGADAIGLVSAMPSGPGQISLQRIAAIAEAMRDRIETVLLTRHANVGDVFGHYADSRCRSVQLCAPATPDQLAVMSPPLDRSRICPVIHVTGPEAIELAKAASFHCGRLLLDSGRPGAAHVELGGTGRIHDWELSRSIVDGVAVPVILAGGLNPENVGQAIRAVRPWGVDVCSGLRVGGRLNERLLRTFMRSVADA